MSHSVERHRGVGSQFSWNGSRSRVHGSRQGTMVGHVCTYGVVTPCCSEEEGSSLDDSAEA